MTNRRRNLGVQIRTPGGDNPLLLDLVAPGPYFRGVATSGIRFVGKGGVQPYAFSVLSTSSNSLPPGLSIASPLTGEVTGTPTQAGRFSFIAEIADSAAATFTRSFTIEIKAQLFWQGPPPPIGELTVPYRYQFRVLDGSGTLLTSGFTSTGTIPPGLSLSAAGLLSGTPTAPAGISYFTVHATDGTDSIDIPIALEIVEAVDGHYLEDRDPPAGWGGGAGTWLPSMVRLQDWIAHLVITGGVGPYSLAPSPVNPPPTGIKVMANQRVVAGRTSDAASTTTPVLMSVIVTDALGNQKAIQRAVFIIDSQQGRITPQREGVDVAGGDGFTVLDFKAGPGAEVDVTNDGHVATVTIGVPHAAGVETINDVGPDSAGNVQIGGVFTDSNGDLFVPDYVREVSAASPGTIDVDNSDPQHPVLDHQISGVAAGTYGTSNKVPRIGITDEGHIHSISEQTITAGGAANAGMMYFGDGSDGDLVLDGTNTYAFLTKAGSVYTMTRDVYANDLSFGGTGQIDLAGWRLFVYGTLDVSGTSAQPAVKWSANNGANSAGAGAGIGGAIGSSSGQMGNGGNGGNGGAGTTTNGNNGSGGARGTSAFNNGGRGGPGGSAISGSGGNGASGTGGNSNTNTAPTNFVYRLPYPFFPVLSGISGGTVSVIGGGTGGSGGGGGAGNGSGSGGGGGGGGAGGNFLYVAARYILVTNGLVGVISAAGGNGGNGFTTAAAGNGGGGGGCGGGGGVIHLIYQELTGSGSMTIVATGGTAGNGGGTGGGAGTAGKGGTGGDGGLVLAFNVTAGTVTPSTPSGGSAGSGQTGGAGGASSLTLTA